MFLNALAPIFAFVSFDVFNVIVASFLSPENAVLPMLVSFVELTVTVVSAVQFANALVPMDVTFVPICTVFNFLQPENALFATAVTLNL